SIIENVDENSLSNEIQLPISNANNDRHSEELLDVNTIESFHKYQQKIPKTCKILSTRKESTNYFGLLSRKDKMPNLVQMCTEEELKMSTTFPLFSAKIGYKIDMKGTLIKTLTKFEIISGEVSGVL
ncbi:13129_t:CDS:2, partial [Entrophospora sp. SA101]